MISFCTDLTRSLNLPINSSSRLDADDSCILTLHHPEVFILCEKERVSTYFNGAFIENYFWRLESKYSSKLETSLPQGMLSLCIISLLYISSLAYLFAHHHISLSAGLYGKL